MATGLIGALRVTLGIDAAQFTDGVKGVQKHVRVMQKSFETWGNRIGEIGKAASIAITLPFAALVKEAIPAAKEGREAMGQVNAALASMGPVSGRTSEQLEKTAKQLESLSTFSHTEILRKVTANMLTFGNVSKSVFDEAQVAAINLSARLGQDLQHSTIMVGKALNDPVKGIQAMRRVGVAFTQDQQDQIKALVKSGHLYQAQGMILHELTREFGGAALAMRQSNPQAAMTQAWVNFKEAIGEVALKVLPPLTKLLTDLLNTFNGLDPHVQATALGLAAIAAAVGPIMVVLGPMVKGVGALIPLLAEEAVAAGTAAAATAGLEAALAPIAVAVGIVAGAALAGYEAWQHWGEIEQIMSSVGQAINTAIGPQVSNMIQTISAAASELWHGPFGADVREALSAALDFGKGLLQVFGPVIVGALRGFAVAIGQTFKIAGDVLNVIAALLRGDFSGAWTYAKKTFTDAMNSLPAILNGILPGATAALAALYNGVKAWLGDKISSVLDGVHQKIVQVGDWFKDLYDRVIGHSYIPDMVAGIDREMATLDDKMVKPVKLVEAKVGESFKRMKERVAENTKRMKEAAVADFEAIKQAMSTLLDRLFPEEARHNQFLDDLNLLETQSKRLGLSADQTAEAIRRLKQEYEDEAHPFVPTEVPDWLKNPDVLDSMGGDNRVDGFPPLADLKKQNDDALQQITDATKDKTLEMAQAWAGMARDAVSSLKGMVQSFKSGDILGGIEKLLDIVVQVVGLLGHKTAAATPVYNRSSGGGTGFATGGSFKVGGSGGVDSQLIRFRATPGEHVSVRRGDQMDKGRPVFQFDLRGAVMTNDLLAQMNAMTEDAAQRGAVGGAGLAARQMARARRRRLA